MTVRNWLRNGRGQGFVEILVALIFLATGGLAIYSASIRNVEEAAWGAEKIMAEAALNDLSMVVRGYTFRDLTTRAEVKPSESALTAVDDVGDLMPLTSGSLLPTPRAAATPEEIRADAIARNHAEALAALGLKRFIVFKEEPAGSGRGVGICLVTWKSRAGIESRLAAPFVTFRTD